MRDDIVMATFTGARGESITWGVDGAHVLVAAAGLDGLTGIITTSRAPGQDGETWLASRMPMRTVTLTCAAVGEGKRQGDLRAQLMRVCSPRLGSGWLTVTAYGRTRRIAAYVDSAPISMGDTYVGWQEYQIVLTCPDPYWQDMQAHTLELTAQAGGLRFPLRLPTRFAQVNTTRRWLARNAGDGYAPVLLEFYGRATRPTLKNLTTGESITIGTAIPEGSTLVIDTTFGGKRAYLRAADGSETDAMGYLTLDSIFWGLQPGDNFLGYDAEDGLSDARVTARWVDRYAGL